MNSFLKQTVKSYHGDKGKRADIIFYVLFAFFLLANYSWETFGRYGIAIAAVSVVSFGIFESFILVRGIRKITNRSIVKLAVCALAIIIGYTTLPLSAWAYILTLSGIISLLALWITRGNRSW